MFFYYQIQLDTLQVCADMPPNYYKIHYNESPCSHVIKKSLLYPEKLIGNNKLKYNKHYEGLWQYRYISFGEMLVKRTSFFGEFVI